jgi:hypothetical protein
MIFRSDRVKAQRDTWAYYHQGTYYLYYLITEDSPGEGFGVATSEDGVLGKTGAGRSVPRSRWSTTWARGWAVRTESWCAWVPAPVSRPTS